MLAEALTESASLDQQVRRSDPGAFTIFTKTMLKLGKTSRDRSI